MGNKHSISRKCRCIWFKNCSLRYWLGISWC